MTEPEPQPERSISRALLVYISFRIKWLDRSSHRHRSVARQMHDARKYTDSSL